MMMDDDDMQFYVNTRHSFKMESENCKCVSTDLCLSLSLCLCFPSVSHKAHRDEKISISRKAYRNAQDSHIHFDGDHGLLSDSYILIPI